MVPRRLSLGDDRRSIIDGTYDPAGDWSRVDTLNQNVALCAQTDHESPPGGTRSGVLTAIILSAPLCARDGDARSDFRLPHARFDQSVEDSREEAFARAGRSTA
jgi:hypothetical protein